MGTDPAGSDLRDTRLPWAEKTSGNQRQQLPCHLPTVAVEYRILAGLGNMPPGQIAADRQPGYPTCFPEAA